MCLISVIYWVFPSANPSKRHGRRHECGRIDLGGAERGDEPEDNQFCGHCDGSSGTFRSSGGGSLTTHTDMGANTTNASIVVRGRSGDRCHCGGSANNTSGVGSRARSENSPSSENDFEEIYYSENTSSVGGRSRSEEDFRSQVNFSISSSGDRSSSNNDGPVGQSRAAAVQFQPLPPRAPPAVGSQPETEERSPTRRIPGSFED